MKKGLSYVVNHLANQVTVTRKFFEASMVWGSKEDELMEQFKQRGFSIEIEQRKKRNEKSYAEKLKAGKTPMLTYAEMRSYIVKLDDAEEMVREFDQIRETAKERKNRVAFVNQWFRSEFPNYDNVPEFDEKLRIVHNPNAA